MPDLKAIRGNKPKAMAQARLWQCPPPCGSTGYTEKWVGLLIGKNGKVLHKGTLIRRCSECKRIVE